MAPAGGSSNRGEGGGVMGVHMSRGNFFNKIFFFFFSLNIFRVEV